MPDSLSSQLAELTIDRGAPPPRAAARRPRRLLPLAIAAGLVASGAAAFVVLHVKSHVLDVETVVVAAPVAAGEAPAELTTTGYVEAERAAHVGADVSGRVARVAVREGAEVHGGDVLFELDAADRKAAVATARARAAAAAAHAKVARAELADAEQRYEREARLVSVGASPASSADDERARLATLRAAAQAADADARASGAEASAIAAELTHLRVLAPFDAVAVTEPASVGDVVTPGATLVELVDPASLLVEADVPEARLGAIREGQPCAVVLDAFPDQRLRGAVVGFGARVDKAKATGVVKIRLDERPPRLLPHMAARVSILRDAAGGAVAARAGEPVVPAAAVVSHGDAKVVFVVEGDHARAVPVRLGREVPGGFEIEGGLTAGARVVTTQAPGLHDGDAVDAKETR